MTFLTFTLLCGNVPMTWYGDTFLGMPHAASWWGATPSGMPKIVTDDFPGVAAPHNIPFGTRVLICSDDRCAEAIVLDRTRDSQGWDAWPETARRLGFGPTLGGKDPGRISVKVYKVTSADYGWNP